MKAYCKECNDYTIVFVFTPDKAHVGQHECTQCGAIKGWLPYPEPDKPESEKIGA
ncbi:MAG: hypothetical protein V4714_17720 [Bacteroidota bacterium]